ncbi:MAG: hypothetical protein ACP5K1_04285 [Candidatus Bathyarchaeia archaeon]
MDEKYKPVFERMISEGNLDKSVYKAKYSKGFAAFCSPLESYVWIYKEDDRKADKLLENYGLKRMITEGFRNTDISNNYKSEEWKNYETAANRLGWHEWVNWKWVKDNLKIR